MRRVLIIGATSAIAEACARRFAAAGDQIVITGRDAQRLEAIRADLVVRGAVRVVALALDVNDLAAHERVLNEASTALGGLDTALVAHGTLPDQGECERSVETALREFATNGTSTIALLTRLAQRFEPQRSGTIAVISSVAGDRGRQSNYLYGAAKAAVTTFASGLRQRLSRTGVQVVTIKPGFVDTPMTRDFPKGALWAKPDAIAAGIVAAMERRRNVAYLPWFWWPIMAVIKSIPEFLFKRLKL